MRWEQNISPQWLESQFRLWQETPEQVSPQLRAFFQGFALGEAAAAEAPAPEAAPKQVAVQALIYRYRDIGHLLACTDPLSACREEHPLLALSAFGLEEADLDRSFLVRGFLKDRATLREILELLRQTYCRSIGVEYMHIQQPEERQWLKDRMESTRNRTDFSREEQRAILEKLLAAARFEAFLHRKFLGQKRFSMEGAEVVVPLLDRLIRRASRNGIRDIILGTTHRGRLNILANIFDKPLANIFAEFKDNLKYDVVGEGDVKYHKGFSTDLDLDGGSIHLTMASNPSHLESVDPVVEGKCRARQDGYGEGGDKKVLPLLVHGDAAFAGQGMVAETLNLSQLEGFGTGGTVHLVINNQIGFTTVPEDARSTLYATDVAKMLMVPIFHVHGDDPEAVLHAADLALDYRQRFGRDVVVEILCYRRHGHNEGDEPYFTQPLMYEKIKDHPPVHEIYGAHLREEGLPGEQIEEMAAAIEERLERAAQEEQRRAEEGFRGKWSEIERDYHPAEVETGVDRETLQSLAEEFLRIPEGFHPHDKVEKFFARRLEAIREGEGIDWAFAESLAFASLLHEGTTTRFSGQDSRRGTFNQRHSTLYDMRTGEAWVPLAGLAKEGAAFRIYDSTLAEASVLGFEYGYSLESPRALTIWEAQFGDFANGAQVIIDQFIVSSQTKWDRVSGLVMLLPHGFEGQGPEHSSARIERYLQACADDNIQVAYPSTPAQFFHLLRRQVRQPFRRPLIVFTPKSLLRLPACRSSLADFTAGSFREVLPAEADAGKIKSVLLCSGKIYYELMDARQEKGREDVAVVRVEQLYPLRTDLLKKALDPFRDAGRFAWVQEEPRNMGAWGFLRPHLAGLLGEEPRYVGREEAPSPAVGSHRLHREMQEKILEEAFSF